MKKLLDAVFLLLPPVVGTVMMNMLLQWQIGYGYASDSLVVMGPVFAFLGVPLILFSKNIANLSAKIHSYWHPVYYEDAQQQPEAFTGDRSRTFRPTKFSYGLTVFGAVTFYLIGLAAILYEIVLLRTL